MSETPAVYEAKPRRICRRPHYKAEVIATRKAFLWAVLTLAVSLLGNIVLLLKH
jgi:hypothetical protein